jgi:hypothetical protein
MKAARMHRFGPPDVIGFEAFPNTSPTESDVLVVRIGAAGVGP